MELILIHLLLILEPGIVAGRVVTTVTLVESSSCWYDLEAMLHR